MATPSAQTVLARWQEEAVGRFFMPRESYLPQQARGKDPILPEGTDLAIWPYEVETDKGIKYYAIAFAGKQSKPLWHYAFRSEADRDRSIKETIASRKSVLEDKNRKLQERREFKHEFNVGDILDSSWGYDETHVDFFEVIEILGSQMVAIRQIGGKVVKEERGADYVVPVPSSYHGPVLRRRVSPGHGVKINSYSWASKWDGKPKYQTAFGYGH